MGRTAAGIAAALAGLAVLFAGWACRPATPPPAAPPAPQLLWTFEAPRPGSAVAAPLATADAVYLAAIHAQGFHLSGAVYALDPATGKTRWTFDRDGDMLPTASSPLLAGGRLVVGEGMHANFVCHCYGLDPATGREAWAIQTGDHVEGGPAAAAGLVVFPAGNDGLIAADPATGAVRWRFAPGLHIDSTPAVAGGRVFAGSGPSRRFKPTEVACLEAATGAIVWRAPLPLPAWASPVVADGNVFVGLGNGRLTEGAKPPETPAGALACLDAATGAVRWTFPAGDAVFGQPAVAAGRVVFGSRDGYLYAVGFDGREAWRVPMGGPVVAGPAAGPGSVVAVSVGGRVVCVDPETGAVRWQLELARPGLVPFVYAPPRLAGDRLYLAAELRPPGAAVGLVALFCYELPGGGRG